MPFNLIEESQRLKLLYKLHFGYLNPDHDTVVDTLLRFGDQSGVYTPEEEAALEQVHNLLDKDDVLQQFTKLIPKSITLVFLRRCKMDVDLVFQTVGRLYTFCKNSYPDLFARIRASKLLAISESRMLEILKPPRNNEDEPSVLVFRIENWKPEEICVEEIILYGFIFFFTAAKSSPEIQRRGFIIIGDMHGFCIAHARHVTTIDLLSKAVTFVTKVPNKLVKGAVLINCSTLVPRTYSCFKWLLPGRIRKIIHLTQNDLSPITRLISADRLPIELGGTVQNDLAYDGDIVKNEIFADVKLIPNIAFLINGILIWTGHKQRT